ncbi:MAG TPA: type II toxin-antitoxin system YafQ family toxin [Candidatus Paceibacterota bacterium]|nr:type II toxin-antitoxin system YafQ family toxin [Candidatus Paceibacterota bacterium]
MRTIERTAQFKKDYKREKRSPRGKNLDKDLTIVLELLLKDLPLAAKYGDHPLSGEWKSFRDCHIRPDLILIYRQHGSRVLQVVRLGSHSQLSL